MLQEKFDGFIAAAYGNDLDPKSAQAADLKNAFIAGSLVTFVYLLGCETTEQVQKLQDDLASHGQVIKAAAKVYEAIMKHGHK